MQKQGKFIFETIKNIYESKKAKQTPKVDTTIKESMKKYLPIQLVHFVIKTDIYQQPLSMQETNMIV